MKTVELFAGIGGFRLASDQMGWKTVWANDLSPNACAVYRDRFGSDVLHEGDFPDLKDSVPSHDVLTGGFPCQPFSSAGKKEGTRDVRGTLFQLIVDVLRKERPRFFILENVKRLLTMEKGCHFATILGSFADLDYSIEWRLLNTMHFGLPQNRERVVIVGARLSDRETWQRVAPIRLALPADLSVLDGRQQQHLFEQRYWNPISDHRDRFPDWGLASKGRFFGRDLSCFSAASQPVLLGDVLEKTVSMEFDFTQATQKWLAQNTPVNRLIHGVERQRGRTARETSRRVSCRRRGFRWHREMRKLFPRLFHRIWSVARLPGDLRPSDGYDGSQTPARKTVMPVSLTIGRSHACAGGLYRASLSRPSR